MMLHFDAVWQLQTVVSCPSCGKEGNDTGFKDCCFRFALMRLGIQDKRECPLCGENFVTDDDEIGCRPGYCSNNVTLVRERLRGKDGICYAHENCNEEFCKGYKPYDRRFTNGCDSGCLHYGLDGRCTL